MAGLVRVVSGMTQSSRKYKVVEPLLSDLQLRIAEKCSQVLNMEEGDKKVGALKRITIIFCTLHRLKINLYVLD
jgi:peroxiredoxin